MEILIALVVIGFLAHVIGDMSEESTRVGTIVNPLAFLVGRPYRIAMSLLGATAGCLIMIPDLERQLIAGFDVTAYMTALGIGYASDSLINKFANMATNRLEKKHGE